MTCFVAVQILYLFFYSYQNHIERYLDCANIISVLTTTCMNIACITLRLSIGIYYILNMFL